MNENIDHKEWELHSIQEENARLRDEAFKRANLPAIIEPIPRETIATVDFETRNVTNDKLLFRVGAFNYSRHPSTKILCLAYKLPGNASVKYWYNAAGFKISLKEMAPPQDLFDYIAAGGLVEAHNVFFERAIWTHCAETSLDWPAVPPSQWRCSMAKALACSLPKSLEDGAKAMGLSEKKDEAGKRLMILMTSSYAYDNIKNIKRLIAYCIQDVKTEMSLSEILPDLGRKEIGIWREDLEMNWRGVTIDMELVDKAQKHIDHYTDLVNNRVHHMIGVPRTTMRGRIKDWFADTGAPIDNTQKEYLQGLQAKFPVHFDTKHQEIIRLMLANNLSSIAKFKKICQFVDRQTNKIYSNFIYHGGHTGRYTSVGVQLHNFIRETIANIENVIALAKTDTPKQFALRAKPLGGVGQVLSKCLRGAIIPSQPGMQLIVSDYAAIEARVLFWLAGETEALQILASGEDIYCKLAERIFSRVITKADKMERQLGKQAILGLGYGMGWFKFLMTLRKYNIHLSLELCKDILGDQYNDYYTFIIKDGPKYGLAREDRPEAAVCKFIVDIYRGTYLRVVAYWKQLEKDAIYARGQYRYERPFLKHRLVSGKDICYPYPKRRKTTTPWGTETYEFSAALVHGSHFNRVGFYGGKHVENITQATAREILCEAIVDIAASEKYTMVLHAHDENVAEAFNPDIAEFDKLMLPERDWLKGCPLAVETHICERWQKF